MTKQQNSDEPRYKNTSTCAKLVIRIIDLEVTSIANRVKFKALRSMLIIVLMTFIALAFIDLYRAKDIIEMCLSVLLVIGWLANLIVAFSYRWSD